MVLSRLQAEGSVAESMRTVLGQRQEVPHHEGVAFKLKQLLQRASIPSFTSTK